MSKQVWNFKKGQQIHLDSVYDVQAWVLPNCTPINLHNCRTWDPDLSDDYKVNKDFTVTVIVDYKKR